MENRHKNNNRSVNNDESQNMSTISFKRKMTRTMEKTKINQEIIQIDDSEEIIQIDDSDEFIPFIKDSDDEMKFKSKTIPEKRNSRKEGLNDSPNASTLKHHDKNEKRNEKDESTKLNQNLSFSKGNDNINLLKFNMPWMGKRGIKWQVPGIIRLHHEIIEFVNWISPTKKERIARSETIERLSRVINGLWPTARVEVFGSHYTDLYLPLSDIDIVVQLKENQMNSSLPIGSSNCQGSLLRKLARAIRKNSIASLGSILVISRARVPIIKYKDRKLGIEIDISFNITSGVESAAIMKEWRIKYPAMRPLVLVLKAFLAQRQLNKVFSGGLGSYSLMCMVISLLQTHPLVQTDLIKAHENLGMILLDFLELYGRNFNYEEVGISLNSIPISSNSTSSLSDNHDLNEFGKRTRNMGNDSYSPLNLSKEKKKKDDGTGYFSKYDRGWWNEQRPLLLSIEDPQNPDSDIARTSFNFQAIRMAFEHAFDILKSSLLQVYNMQERNSPLNDHASILGNIIRIDEPILKYRLFIQKN